MSQASNKSMQRRTIDLLLTHPEKPPREIAAILTEEGYNCDNRRVGTYRALVRHVIDSLMDNREELGLVFEEGITDRICYRSHKRGRPAKKSHSSA